MALFKISKGNSANLPTEMHDGYCYFTIDDGRFYIDYLDINDNNTLKRRPISGVSVEYIEGTQTASTNLWTGVTRDNALYKGKIIAYKLPKKGTSTAATLNLTLSNGNTSGEKAVKRQGGSGVTTEYPAGTVIFMAYDGTYWQVNADYNTNTNTFVTQSSSSSSDWRKVLLHYSTNAAGGAVPAEVTNRVYAAQGIEVQPSTGTLAATKFKGPLEGNADTATEFSSDANVTLTGDVTGSTNSKKGWSVATTLANSGVTAGNYGPSENATPDYGDTFNVPYITVDSKGRITAASTKTVKIPASDNTTYTLSGAYNSGNTTWITTLTPSSGSATTSTVPAMVGATSSAAGKAGLVPPAAAADRTKFLRADGTWQTPTNTDTLVTQTNVASTTNKNYRIILSNDENDTTETKTVNKNTNLRYNPSTNKLSTGSLDLSAALTVAGTADLNGETTADSLTVGNLQVNGSATFVNTINGNAATAAKLQTARTINGTSFDGSANITTANWGTARNISISDSDGTNTGAAISVNGSGAVTLKLPATIKANLTGNAASATKITQNASNTNNTAYRILLSGTATDSAETTSLNKASNLQYNPSTNKLSTGNLDLTGELNVTGNTNLHNSTTIDDLTAGSLIVNGNSSFVNDVTFTKIPTAPTAAAGTNNTQLATTAFVMNAFTANDAMVFKGVVNSASGLPTTHYQGWTYKVGTAGSYVGTYCEVGDLIICVTDGTSANNAHWAVIQNNVDGAVFMGHGDSAIGSATQPVYVKANGEVTAGTELKALAYKDSISYTPAGTITDATLTPAGTNAASEVTISPKTTSVYSMSSTGSVTSGVAASLAMSVDDEVLSFSWTTNTPTAVTLPDRTQVTGLWNGYNTGVSNTYAAAQTFTGTAASHNHTFSGTAATLL